MTYVPRARLALQDAMYVRQKLEGEEGVIEWRLLWILVIVLLRTVGHVLDKVDGKADRRVGILSKGLYKEWQRGDENAIFRDFIERERNSILKEYEISMSEGPIPVIAHLQNFDGFDVARQFLIEENLYRPIGRGPYEGEDGRTLLDEAIDWWRVQLEAIDLAMKEISKTDRK